MKKSIVFKTLSVVLAITVLFASCSSATLIQSNPSGAKVYMDGQYMGTTPYSYSDTKIIGSITEVRLEKEGYETFHTFLSRNERADVGAIIGGFLCVVPFLWTMGYNPVHTYELRPLGTVALSQDTPTMLTDANGNEYISGVLRD